MAQSVKRLPSAQVMISGSWDGAAHWAPCSVGSLLLPLPLSLLVLFSLSLSNKGIKFFLKILFIYLTEITSRQREREGGEVGSPLCREPHAGLHPRTLRS